MGKSFRQRLNISRLAIKYPWLTISFWLAIAVAGLFAFFSLKYALFPDITFPVVIVKTEANLENIIDTETKLTNPLEKAILTLENIENVSSSTLQGQSVISVLFFAGDKLTEATNKVKQAIQPVNLPKNTQIEVIPYNLNESNAISYVLKSENLSLTEISEIAKTKIIPSLESIKGILQVNLLGVSTESLDNKNTQGLTRMQPSLVRWNGENAIAIQVVKKGDANTLEVVKLVESQIKQIKPQLTDISIHLAQTEANYIKEATQATIDSLFLAIILAIIVIYPFLNSFIATLITAIAIPLSLLGTFIVMAIANLNLETLTLLALALVIGIVVDDAIVDVENIQRLIEKGKTPKQAAIEGTDEIGLTVSASTLTIVAVFLPIAFMQGNLGQFFKPFALTVSASVIISLLVARTLSPVLAMFWLKKGNQQLTINNSQISPVSKLGNFILTKYTQLLKRALNHRWLVVGLAILSFIAGIALIPLIPQGFIPQLDRGEFNIIYTSDLPQIPEDWNFSQNKSPEKDRNQTKDNSSFNWFGNLAENPNGFLLRRTRRIGEKIEKTVLESPEVESVFTIVGFRGQPNKGKIYVKLKDDREFSTLEIQQQIRNALPEIKGANISVEDLKFVDTGDGKPITINLTSDNLTILYDTANLVKNTLKNLPALTDISTSATATKIENENNLFIIEHFNNNRVVTISANLKEGEALGNVSQEIDKIVKSLLPPEVTLYLGGDSARMQTVINQFLISLGLSIILMLLVLFGLFRSFLEPLIVGLALPLSVVGAMLALLLTQSELGMISFIGIIFLLGLLDKSALLLVDYANQLQRQGISRKEAILTTGKVRLRPILMTTFSTILGMLPIAIGWGAGAELRQPMAVAIIGGLITSTLLSLIFVPVCYSLIEDWWDKFKSK